MGLRVATNIPSLNAQRNIENNSKELAKSLSRLSSGQRIVNAGDDAAGLAISQNLEAQVRGLQQSQRNANDGVSLAQTAEGALNEVSNLLIRLRELGVQSASDTIGDTERGFLNKEHETLKAEIQRIAEVTEFNGRKLLDGSQSNFSIQVGPHSGEQNIIHYDASQANATVGTLGISGTSVADRDSAADGLESIDGAINKVNEYRANLGAVQNRLHSAANNLGIATENMSEAKSRLSDTDIAEESANLARRQILQSAGIAVLAQANTSQSSSLKLL